MQLRRARDAPDQDRVTRDQVVPGDLRQGRQSAGDAESGEMLAPAELEQRRLRARREQPHQERLCTPGVGRARADHGVRQVVARPQPLVAPQPAEGEQVALLDGSVQEPLQVGQEKVDPSVQQHRHARQRPGRAAAGSGGGSIARRGFDHPPRLIDSPVDRTLLQDYPAVRQPPEVGPVEHRRLVDQLCAPAERCGTERRQLVGRRREEWNIVFAGPDDDHGNAKRQGQSAEHAIGSARLQQAGKERRPTQAAGSKQAVQGLELLRQIAARKAGTDQHVGVAAAARQRFGRCVDEAGDDAVPVLREVVALRVGGDVGVGGVDVHERPGPARTGAEEACERRGEQRPRRGRGDQRLAAATPPAGSAWTAQRSAAA